MLTASSIYIYSDVKLTNSETSDLPLPSYIGPFSYSYRLRVQKIVNIEDTTVCIHITVSVVNGRIKCFC